MNQALALLKKHASVDQIKSKGVLSRDGLTVTFLDGSFIELSKWGLKWGLHQAFNANGWNVTPNNRL